MAADATGATAARWIPTLCKRLAAWQQLSATAHGMSACISAIIAGPLGVGRQRPEGVGPTALLALALAHGGRPLRTECSCAWGYHHHQEYFAERCRRDRSRA